ncbi:isocitrate/isopropylmalate dehydrogenase family protein [Labedaea rhizosphaerae]|uniref:3-isopropylmalate dehydrogenase n=1 Tax=Labedaea rhizosphaerae TaxID=598644 RepID=A0A4R6SG43_LABRH|nr:isocitrate/isopropylmalate family dehydrogenase [Labedaea rhizosphaerae]TDQ00490.1 3-isopropylmalate dehydrogenase [Labedaea rhizosphaerae]
MTGLRITVLPGDGIGPEVVAQALAVLDAVAPEVEVDVLDRVNATTFARTGAALTDDDLARIRASDALLLGAIGDPSVRSPDYARGVLLRLRFELDLYVNQRPAVLLHARLSPLRDPARRGIDCVIVRENTEGAYTGIGGTLRKWTPHETAIDADVSTYHGVSRVIEHAFRIARREVCVVDKANAVPFGGELWQRCWREAAGRHPGIATSHLYVDVAAMTLVSDPTRFDVVVASNAHGDILSDVAAAVAGGLGAAPSANLDPATGFGLYEPVHGSAPDIAGTGVANPLGAIASLAMLLADHGHEDQAQAIQTAIRSTVDKRRCTPDLGGALTTEQAAAAVIAELA